MEHGGCANVPRSRVGGQRRLDLKAVAGGAGKGMVKQIEMPFARRRLKPRPHQKDTRPPQPAFGGAAKKQVDALGAVGRLQPDLATQKFFRHAIGHLEPPQDGWFAGSWLPHAQTRRGFRPSRHPQIVQMATVITQIICANLRNLRMSQSELQLRCASAPHAPIRPQ
jgi:hypothetical protein